MEYHSIIRYLVIVAAIINPLANADDYTKLEQRITELESKIASTNESWYDTLSFSGLIEIQADYTNPDSGDSSSDLVVATAALGIEAILTENLSMTLALLYEEDDTDLEVDVATLSYINSNNGLSFTLGQDYLPFGNYSTTLINDPLTLELGEARETTLVANYENGQFTGAFYVFNGDQDEDDRDQLTNFGTRIVFTDDQVTVGIDYISNLADSDSLQEGDYGLGSGEDVVDGTSVYSKFTIESVQFFVEHLRALDKFAVDGNNSEPTATHVEIAYAMGAFTYAAAYHKTDEALFLALPEERFSLGLITEVLGGLNLGMELVRDEDYATTDGGTGEFTDSIVIQLAAEF